MKTSREDLDRQLPELEELLQNSAQQTERKLQGRILYTSIRIVLDTFPTLKR